MNDYSDILHCTRPPAPHPMSRDARAAQFAPYAALTGHSDIIHHNEAKASQRNDVDHDIIIEFDAE